MDSTAVLSVILLCFFAFVVAWLFRTNRKEKHKKYPPYPWTLPILGNIHQLKGPPHEAFDAIAKKLGPIFSISMFGSRFIVVNNYQAAREVLVTKDAFLAGRPQRYISSLYSNDFKGIIVTDYGKDLINRRKIVHSALQLHDMESLIQEECDALISNLKTYSAKKVPVDPSSFVLLSVTNVICGLVFGSRYDIDDIEFREVMKINEWIMKGITEAQMVEALPLLRYLPNKTLALLRKAVIQRDHILEKKLKEHEVTFRQECTRDITDGLLKCLYAGTQHGKSSIDREMVKMIIADIFIAGALTTAEALQWCLLYFTAYPKVQHKIQQQIDDALNNNKSLGTTHRSLCPYLMASIYEVLRLATVTPLGLPHKAIKDTTILGYDIPKGTTVLCNFYALHQDDTYWPNAQQFRPERFLDEAGNLIEKRESYYPFSFGRRHCLGEKLAKTELFMMLFNLLACFSLNKPNSDYVFDFTGEFRSTTYARPFKILFSVRK